ncbi:hypothetical protein [Nostoc sp.]|uniref:hypothetical protein n=1 Tax=Nostoc sp. TaxID=1180 RepID=UPI002FF6B57F
MMQPFAASPNPAFGLQQVLGLLDGIAKAQGRDVPQIVEIQRLRFLPTGTYL